jgi:glycine betaine/choline ABC-type transport system substrate-binding protein
LILTGASAGIALTALGGPSRGFAQDGDKPTMKIGSKSYTEQNIMGEALALLLEGAGYQAERNLNLGGTAIAHEALVSGDIDTYVEYTGTGLVAILGMDTPEDEDQTSTPEAGVGMDPAYNAVAERYPEEFNVQWLKPWGFNNTYGLAVLPETAEKYNLKTFSDLEDVAGELTLGTDQEFPIREDGLPAFEQEYGFSFGDVISGDIGLMYSALINGEVDVLNSYATDGRIPEYDLVLLEDDRNFFPPYYAAPIVRLDVLDANPDLIDILNQPAGKIDNLKMAEINNLVDGKGVEPRDAAQQLLEDIGVL